MIIRALTIAASAAALGFAAAPAFAQQQAQSQAQSSVQMQIEPIDNAELTDAQVASFIDAAMAIQLVVQDFQPQLEAAESQEQAMALQQQAQTEVAGAVDAAGLTAEQYQSIAAAAQTDPAVAQRLQAEAQARQTAE